MRAYFLLTGILLSGCSSQNTWLPGPANSIPSEVVMEGLEGTLSLRVGSNVAWRIDTFSGWLTATPHTGIGPRLVRLKANLAGEPQNQQEYFDNLRVSGDLDLTITVRLPLVRVVGAVADGGVAQGAGAQELATMGLRSETRPNKASTRPVEILVKYRSDLRAVVLPQGSRVLSHDRISRITKLHSQNPQALLQQLRLDPSVEWAEINGTVRAQGEPTDQFYPLQWYLRSTGARFTYLQTYHTPITVAVVDTGVCATSIPTWPGVYCCRVREPSTLWAMPHRPQTQQNLSTPVDSPCQTPPATTTLPTPVICFPPPVVATAPM